MFGRYHVTEPTRFYDGSANVAGLARPRLRARCRATPTVGARPTSAAPDRRRTTSRRRRPRPGARIDPYYLNIRLPGQEDRSTSSSRVPFVPVSSGNSQTRLVSFLTANSDPGQYGELQSFTMPQGQTVEGPVQVNNDIIRTTAISQAITLLNQQGSQVIQGSMQLIPVGNSI